MRCAYGDNCSEEVAVTIKSILCVFGGTPEELNALNVAFALGELHQAHIRFLHVSRDPAAYVHPEDMVVELINRIEEENKTRLTKAKQYVTTFAARHHVPLDDSSVPLHHMSAQFLHLTGMVGDFVAREGRLSDLIIISRGISPAHMSYESTVLAALFDTGRPLLLLPSIRDSAIVPWQDKTIVLAWNGSLESARAMYHALPYLERAEKLYILHAHEHQKTSNVTETLALTNYLQTHGIKMAEAISIDAGHHSISEALLSQAKELRADLLVMGAYGHNRYREMLLGGVTNDMLEKADLPLLLSH
jgi:nucleotide-binding universal stress UspA family protein